MPEMRFQVAWPDGTIESCYSPSLVIRDYFEPGAPYALADFLHRSRTALAIASDRVQAKYGFPCARAQAQLARIEQAAAGFADVPDAVVRVLAFTD
jgi:uncharacterized repeat protein (TIGR04042 family)